LTLASCQNKKTAGVVAGQEKSAAVDEESPAVNYTEEKFTLPEFLKWCADEKNNLSKSKQISEMKFSLAFLPKECMAFLELRTEKYDIDKFQSVCNHYEDMSYFNFRIEQPGGQTELLKYNLHSPAQYEERIRYMSFEMQNDIFLLQGQDTLRPGLYQFERIFEVAPYATVQLAFDNKKFDRKKEFTICYNDRLFEKGFIKFNYKNWQLTNLPIISEL
jgi:hypothetical protein